MNAIYPGTFDPITFGHLDIVERAAKIFDFLIIAMPVHSTKNTLFSVQEREEHLNILTSVYDNVEVKTFDGLLADFARKNDIKVTIRGLRNIADYEYEFQMASANKILYKELETFFIPTKINFGYLSSSLVKEVAILGGNIDKMVPTMIAEKIVSKIKERKQN